MRTTIALLTILIPAVSQAAPLTFQFATTVDATGLGGSVTTPFTVTYTFDSALPDGSGPFSPISSTVGSYGPIAMQIQLGNEIVSASGGGISVFNNATTIVEDSYEVRASDSDFIFSGQLFGRDIRFFRFLLVDEDHTMFSSKALPLSPGFASAADFQQTELEFLDRSGISIREFPITPLGQRTPFTLTVVPEPSSIVLLGIGLLTIGGRSMLGKSRRVC